MTEKEELEEYLNKVLGYICGDIEHLKNKGVTVGFPYLFLCFAGIDFLGGLELGFCDKNSRKRSAYFISTWMSKINPKYHASDPEDKVGQASYLYKFARSGLVHMACVQRSVVIENDNSCLKYHLSYVEKGGKFEIFIHPTKFVEEFLEAKEIFLKVLYSDHNKVIHALNNLKKYFMESEEKENKFTIFNLFEKHTDPSGFTYSLGASGTQAPQ